MNNSKEQHKKIKAQQKAKKELDTEIQCKECCIAFKDRKSYQRHMSDEHQGLTGTPYSFPRNCENFASDFFGFSL